MEGMFPDGTVNSLAQDVKLLAETGPYREAARVC